jgi:hypothetical protein
MEYARHTPTLQKCPPKNTHTQQLTHGTFFLRAVAAVCCKQDGGGVHRGAEEELQRLPAAAGTAADDSGQRHLQARTASGPRLGRLEVRPATPPPCQRAAVVVAAAAAQPGPRHVRRLHAVAATTEHLEGRCVLRSGRAGGALAFAAAEAAAWCFTGDGVLETPRCRRERERRLAQHLRGRGAPTADHVGGQAVAVAANEGRAAAQRPCIETTTSPTSLVPATFLICLQGSNVFPLQSDAKPRCFR